MSIDIEHCDHESAHSQFLKDVSKGKGMADDRCLHGGSSSRERIGEGIIGGTGEGHADVGGHGDSVSNSESDVERNPKFLSKAAPPDQSHIPPWYELRRVRGMWRDYSGRKEMIFWSLSVGLISAVLVLICTLPPALRPPRGSTKTSGDAQISKWKRPCKRCSVAASAWRRGSEIITVLMWQDEAANLQWTTSKDSRRTWSEPKNIIVDANAHESTPLSLWSWGEGDLDSRNLQSFYITKPKLLTQRVWESGSFKPEGAFRTSTLTASPDAGLCVVGWEYPDGDSQWAYYVVDGNLEERGQRGGSVWKDSPENKAPSDPDVRVLSGSGVGCVYHPAKTIEGQVLSLFFQGESGDVQSKSYRGGLWDRNATTVYEQGGLARSKLHFSATSTKVSGRQTLFLFWVSTAGRIVYLESADGEGWPKIPNLIDVPENFAAVGSSLATEATEEGRPVVYFVMDKGGIGQLSSDGMGGWKGETVGKW